MQAPKAPDPMQTAQAQSQMNKDTAVTQYGLGATNQITPYGSLTYDQTGQWDDGTPRFQATTSFSPEQQGLYDRMTAAQTQFGDIANTQLDRVNETLSTPWDVNAAAGQHIVDMQQQFLDPQWQRQGESLDARLTARGLTPGSEAWTRAQGDFSDQRSRAYDQMYLDSYKTAVDVSQRERDQPLREISSLLSGSQPQSPQFTSTPSPGVAPTDYSSLVTNQYNQQMGNYNAMMGGLFSIPTAIAGGWARGGFQNPFGSSNTMQKMAY